MTPAWSNPVPCHPNHKGSIPLGPIVYRARLLKDDGTPREITRFWGVDLEGTILIGETTHGRSRFIELASAIRGKIVGRGHGPGSTFFNWFRCKDSKPENVVFEWFDLGPSAAEHGRDPKKWVQAGELLLLDAYRGRHGDIPPCNTQGPKWVAVTDWVRATYGLAPRYLPGHVARLNIPEIAVPGVPAIGVTEARG